MVSRLIQICRIHWWCSLFSVFDWNYSFWANLVQKITIVNWNLVSRLFEYVEFNGSVNSACFRLEIPFLDNLGPKNQNCQFKLQFGTSTNLSMQSSMALFTFSVLDQKHSFRANFDQKIKLVILSWKLLPGLIIRTCRIQWWC